MQSFTHSSSSPSDAAPKLKNINRRLATPQQAGARGGKSQYGKLQIHDDKAFGSTRLHQKKKNCGHESIKKKITPIRIAFYFFSFHSFDLFSFRYQSCLKTISLHNILHFTFSQSKRFHKKTSSSKANREMNVHVFKRKKCYLTDTNSFLNSKYITNKGKIHTKLVCQSFTLQHIRILITNNFT